VPLMKYDNLGNRMKRNYEAPARHTLVRRIPIVVRVDGRAFHTFTRAFQKPFDSDFINAMFIAAGHAAAQMQGFKLAFIQSDEASFVLTDYDDTQTEPWFGGVKSKIETITAAAMTLGFSRAMRLKSDPKYWQPDALFDARAFNVPESDVVNYFLWRAKDWHRNSVSMYARAHFSHAQLRGKRIPDMHEMLHSIGRNWSTDLSDEIKNGTFLVGSELDPRHNVQPTYAEMKTLWDEVNPSTLKKSVQGTVSEPTENANDLE